jgi:hypothetical protein
MRRVSDAMTRMLESSSRRYAAEMSLVIANPALKGRAKFMPTLRVENY